MNLNKYQDQADTTAVYGQKICDILDAADVNDEEGDGYNTLLSVLSVAYVANGFGEEMVEVITLIDEGTLTPENLKKEMGDTVWYIAEGALVYNIRLMDAFKAGVAPPMEMSPARLLTRLIKQSGVVFGNAKRLIRDKKGVIADEDRKAMAIVFGSLIRTMMALADAYMLDFEEILSANLEKLADRKARNVLEGKGNER